MLANRLQADELASRLPGRCNGLTAIVEKAQVRRDIEFSYRLRRWRRR